MSMPYQAQSEPAPLQWNRSPSLPNHLSDHLKRLLTACRIGRDWRIEITCGVSAVETGHSEKNLVTGAALTDGGSWGARCVQMATDGSSLGDCTSTSAEAYDCVCHDGYELNSESTTCTDIDECDPSNNPCGVPPPTRECKNPYPICGIFRFVPVASVIGTILCLRGCSEPYPQISICHHFDNGFRIERLGKCDASHLNAIRPYEIVRGSSSFSFWALRPVAGLEDASFLLRNTRLNPV